jgi:hypothetical protein
MREEKGSVTVFVSLLIIVLMGMMALVTDIGVVYAEKAKLSKAIDAAILAGGQDLPANPTLARYSMQTYLVENGVDLNQVTIDIAADGKKARIVATKPVDHYFGKILGFTQTDITEEAKLEIGVASSASGGLRPFAVVKFDYNFGDVVTLKEGAGDGYQGNYGVVALGGTGTPLVLENALYGYDGTVRVGDLISTEPGNMAGMVNTLEQYFSSIDDQFNDYDRDSDRIWTVPLIATIEVAGRSQVEVVGFAQVFVERVYKISGDAAIDARFIRFVSSGEIDDTLEDTGVYAMRLVN